jgi:DNA-binding CsgD family transcriptional regulator
MSRSMQPELPFVGREVSREEIRRFVRGIGRGEGGSLFVRGPAGIGKTRLLQASLDGLDLDGWIVATGRAFTLEEGVPYGIFSEALSPVLREQGPNRLLALTRGWSSELATLIPGVVPADSVPTTEPGSSPAEVRHRLRWILRDLLLQLAGSDPVLIVLEDLHWADHPSLELLHFLGRHLEGQALGILATLRTGERGEVAREAEELTTSLRDQGFGTVVDLPPLTLGEVEGLLEAAFHIPEPARRGFAEQLHEWTLGSPLFLRELIRGFVRDGRLRMAGDVWVGWDEIDLTLTPDLARTLEGPFAKLSEAAASLGDLAAVCGHRQELWLLELASDLDRDTFGEALEELIATGVLIDSTGPAGDPGSLEFAHPLLQKARYDGLGVVRRKELHTRLAVAMESRAGEEPRWVPALATHVALGGGVQEGGAAGARHLSLAGERALELQANSEAARFFRMAMEIASTAEETQRARMGLGRAHLRLGEFDAAADQFDRVLAAARDAGDSSGASGALRRLAMVEYRRGRRDEALEYLERGVAELGDFDDPGARGALLLAAGICHQELGRPEDAERTLLEALEVAEETGDPVLRARAHRGLLLVNTWLGRSDAAREHGGKALAQARAADLPDLIWSIHWALAVMAGMSGDGEAFADELGHLRDLDVAARSPLRRLLQWELEIHYAWANGSWTDGLTLGEAGISIARELELGSILIRLLVWTAAIHLGQGRTGQAEAYVDEAMALKEARDASGRADVHSSVAVMTGRAGIALEEERYEEAVEMANVGLEMAGEVGYVAWGIQRLLPIVTEAQLRLGNLEAAASHGAAIRETAGRMGHRLGMAWADASDAIGAWLGGDPAGAIEGLRAATEALEAIPMIPDAVRLRRQLAGRLAETGDREGALVELKRVHDTLVGLGAEPELERTRGMFRELDSRPPSMTRADGAGGLTGRELEVASLAAVGKSNKAIGKALGISPRTASTHLSRVFAKLEIGSRSELHRALQERGLTPT